MGKKRKKDEVIVKFVSNSAVDVTGSAILVSYKNNDYLLEFGAVQGFNGTIEKEYALNYQYSRNLNIDNLKCILITHQNFDHVGLIPALVNRGYNNSIIGSYEALEFSKKILFDSAFIINKTVESINGKGKKKVEHLYKEKDVSSMCDLLKVAELNKVYEYDEYMSYMFVPTNHLTGSCQIVMWIKKDNGTTVKIHYSGDLGNDSNKMFKSFLRDTEIVHTSNLIISECTYFGNPVDYTKNDAKRERQEMKEEILKTLKSGGKVVIPAFAMQRSQDIMENIWKFFKDEDFNYPIYVDGNLTQDINNVFRKVLKGEEKQYFEEIYNYHNFKYLRTYKETIACISKREPCIAICSSGMGISGHSVEWIKSSIDCSKDKIIIVGYVPEGSNLDKLYKKEQKTLTWDKHTYIIRCEVIKYNTFSSHKGALDIVNMMKQINTGMIVYHHGSKQAKHNAVEITKNELMKINKPTKVLESYKGMEIKL